MRSLSLVVAACALLTSTAGCKTVTRVFSGDRAAPEAYAVETIEVDVTDADGERLAQLGADYYRAQLDPQRTTVVMVPGAGRVSRKGERSGNGSREYDAPIAFTERFAIAFASAGLNVLAYDKRTCTSADNPLCNNNDRSDIDQEGPAAMAKDVDAACAVPEQNGDAVVLFAHGQAAQTALTSSCAKRAAAVVLIAPMPAAVDKVIVRGLSRRATLLRKWGDKEAKAAATKSTGEKKIEEALALQNKAADLADTFKLLRAKKFPADARVLGAQPSFWTAWMELTENTTALLASVPAPIIVVLGQWDSQYAPADKRKIEAMATTPADFIVIEKGDHYLMVDREDEPSARSAVIEQLLSRLREQGPTS